MEQLVFIIVGIIIGALAGWLIAKLRYSADRGIPINEMEENYYKKDVYESLKKEKDERDERIIILTGELSRIQESNKNLLEKQESQKKEIEKLQETFKTEFENLANKIFETKSEKISKLNEEKIGNILNPLKEKIKDFEKKVEETYDKESKQRFSLEDKIKELVTSSLKLSKDAEHLTLALKGDSKAQGNWGEDLLERILSAAGLKEEIHYEKQANLKDESGNNLRPDYIIKLPDEKLLIIDSKVSLTAYNDFYNSVDEKEKELHLKSHLVSINKHIKELSEKKYQNLLGSTPNYVIMFIPLDGAFYAALDKEKEFYLKAMDKNIVVVTASTLLATLRTISYMWKQENQKRNVLEIARESGAMYDKFVGFVEDLINVGRKMEDAKGSYEDAMKKLEKSPRRSETIIGRIEKLRKLGADASKSIPQSLINRINELPE